jgi:hypothetical protein
MHMQWSSKGLPMRNPCSEKNKINCEIHTDVQIDHFCSQHDVVCCRTCLSESHRSCESVLPLDSASKDVKNSSLLSDTLEDMMNLQVEIL